MAQGKSYEISKRVVWDAYKRVKANRGAAGVDQQSLADFETDLKGNLYKIWNRMSSGSYFPPPVRLVEIPKGQGGTRPLDILRQSHRHLEICEFDSQQLPGGDSPMDTRRTSPGHPWLFDMGRPVVV